MTTVTVGDATGAAIASGLSMTSHTTDSSRTGSSGSAATASTNEAGAAGLGVKKLVALGAGMVLLF